MPLRALFCAIQCCLGRTPVCLKNYDERAGRGGGEKKQGCLFFLQHECIGVTVGHCSLAHISGYKFHVSFLFYMKSNHGHQLGWKEAGIGLTGGYSRRKRFLAPFLARTVYENTHGSHYMGAGGRKKRHLKQAFSNLSCISFSQLGLRLKKKGPNS